MKFSQGLKVKLTREIGSDYGILPVNTKGVIREVLPSNTAYKVFFMKPGIEIIVAEADLTEDTGPW
ncbi:MAG: hypothetical protein AAF901_04295 [Bacteroidota bacterium]